MRNQFLSSLYDKPSDINLYQMFYCGTAPMKQSAMMNWWMLCSNTTLETGVVENVNP